MGGIEFREINVKFEGGLEAILKIGPSGLAIVPTNNNDMTATSLQYMAAVAFLYIGAGLKGLVLDPEFVIEQAKNL